MSRVARTPQRGTVNPMFTVTVASSTKVTIGNSGVTLLTTLPGTDYVMAPPAEGVVKTLCMNQATTGVFVRAIAAGSTGISFTSTGADAVIEFDAAGDKSITLLGLSSTRWQVLYKLPNTTAINVGTS